MIAEPDFRLADFEPADAASELAESRVWAGDLTVLAEHHTTPEGTHSYLVSQDWSMTWGVPCDPALVAIKITRDLRVRTFSFETANHASLAFAQNWLIEHGCPPEEIAQAISLYGLKTGIVAVDPSNKYAGYVFVRALRELAARVRDERKELEQELSNLKREHPAPYDRVKRLMKSGSSGD